MMFRIRALILGFGFFLLLLAIAIFVIGYLDQNEGPYFVEPVSNFLRIEYANLSAELFSIAITVLVIDVIYEWRNTEREKKDLIQRMGSPDSAFAREAVRTLRGRGWIGDGTLRNADLRGADLSEADLHGADLRGAILHRADLAEVDLSKADLRGASLRLTEMREADLFEADLRGADFSEADLRNADLTGAKVTDEQLKQADSLTGATMPDGTRYTS
jgi:uncharacterized protein YjbI with pentapeptide repeats